MPSTLTCCFASDGDVDAIRFNVEANSVTTISMTWTPPSAEQSKSLCMTIAFSAGKRQAGLHFFFGSDPCFVSATFALRWNSFAWTLLLVS